MNARTLFYTSATICVTTLTLTVLANNARGLPKFNPVVRQLTHPPAGGNDVFPAFAPGGKLIAFQRLAPGQGDLMLLDLRTGETEVLVPREQMPSRWNPGGGMQWSPDGSKIVTYDQDTQALWVIELRGAEQEDWSTVKEGFRGKHQ